MANKKRRQINIFLSFTQNKPNKEKEEEEEEEKKKKAPNAC
jgi:hypothetical protein